MPRTELPWSTYQQIANRYFSQGIKPAAIKELLGQPIWEGESWHIKASGKGSIIRERLKGRQQRKAASDSLRVSQSKIQTVGKADFGPNTKGADLEAHHLRMLSLYAPLFAGASEADQIKLAKHAASVGLPLGDKFSNRGDLPRQVHDELHNWMRREGLTGKHMPDFSQADLPNRIKAFDSFYRDIQGSIDQKTMSLMQDYRSKYPQQYDTTYLQRADSLIQKSKSNPKPQPKSPKRNPKGQLRIQAFPGSFNNDIPEIQDEFNLNPGFGTPLGGGRTVEMGDLSI